MSRVRPLQGACNCGRNQYTIIVPQEATEQAEVYFDDSVESRRSQATPLTAWLRVPLSWYSSVTQSFFPDETHSSIRRIFTPLHAPHRQRIFCGYCGTHLSMWTEQPPEAASYMNVSLGSLLSADLHALQELELLPEEIQTQQSSQQPDAGQGRNVQVTPRQQQETITRSEWSRRSAGLTWFEEMLDGSRLGRIQTTRRGIGISNDGSTRVEWEVSEFIDDGSGELETPHTPTGSKRNISEVGGSDDDTSMQH